MKIDALSVSCPVCHAAAGEPCSYVSTTTGDPRSTPHASRLWHARQAATATGRENRPTATPPANRPTEEL